ncbi:S1C family serine protease [Aureliella helgolandensis]|uniref:Serine endoprotease n=1 Tax=Aureliella helgolandensis TaxID=2527968 RepID=A0A518G0W7_9BACT|nr:S1C family serine protease [Aureliella helgolandensis]QDV22241.1 serine endoprotease [Aureliella helgolandensis]
MKHHLLVAGFLMLALGFTYAIYHNATREPRYVGGPVAIVQGTPPRHGMLGVSLSEAPNELMVGDVLVNGPAFQSGIQAADEIIAIDEMDVDSVEQFFAWIQTTQPGDRVVIRAIRSGTELGLDVRLCDFGSILALRRRGEFEELRALPELELEDGSGQ